MILPKSREESLCPVNQCTFDTFSLNFTTSILAGHLNFKVSKASTIAGPETYYALIRNSGKH